MATPSQSSGSEPSGFWDPSIGTTSRTTSQAGQLESLEPEAAITPVSRDINNDLLGIGAGNFLNIQEMWDQSPLDLAQTQYASGVKQNDPLGFDTPAHKQSQASEFSRCLQQANKAWSSNNFDEALSRLDEARSMLYLRVGLPDNETLEPETRATPQKEQTKERMYRCLLCSKHNQPTFTKPGTLKRHVESFHQPQFKYWCPRCPPSCGIYENRRDKLKTHAEKDHGLFRFDSTEINNVRQELACPTQCLLCPKSVQSWDGFYNCLTSHCEFVNTPGDGEALQSNPKAGHKSNRSRRGQTPNKTSDPIPGSQYKRKRTDDSSTLRHPQQPEPQPQPEPERKCPRCPHIVNKCDLCLQMSQCHMCAPYRLAIQSPIGHQAPANRPVPFQSPLYVDPRELTTPGYIQNQGFGQDMHGVAASFPADPYTYTGGVFPRAGSQDYRTGTRNAPNNRGNWDIGDDSTIMVAAVPEPDLPLIYDSHFKGPSVMGPGSILRRLGKWINPLATKSQPKRIPMELLSSVLPGTWDYLSIPPRSNSLPLLSTTASLEPVPECNCPCRAMPRPQYIARTRKAVSTDRHVEVTFKVAAGDTQSRESGESGHSHALWTRVQVVVRLLKLRSSVATESSDKKQKEKAQEGDTDENADSSALEPSSSQFVTAISSLEEELEGEWAFTTDLQWLIQKLLDLMNSAGSATSSKLVPHDADDELKSVYVLVMHIVLFFLNMGRHGGGMLLTE
ncbi:hypothetical protein N7474_005475 [Penicillium riverlandense]|uniref:uncharacterized protein n=1 Tax=Penicillium riverlandense TaxID=1903569 RepID=UPI002546B79C|nr:uncharacterized protein N7474_005475 [Penicillium riverlandense]KAJ5819884.1 hypothetical protein N7474_005475 [Penicillium riverlandense]